MRQSLVQPPTHNHREDDKLDTTSGLQPGPVRFQQQRRPCAIPLAGNTSWFEEITHINDLHPGILSGRDSGIGVFVREAQFGLYLQTSRGFQIDVGGRFVSSDVFARHDSLK